METQDPVSKGVLINKARVLVYKRFVYKTGRGLNS